MLVRYFRNRAFRAKCSILAAASLSFLILSPSADAQRTYYFGRSTNVTPVDIAIQDKDEILNFKVPKAYLTFSKNWSGGVQEFFVLEASFPSMHPLSLAESSIKDTDALFIDLHSYSYTGADHSTRKTISFFIEDRWTLIESITKRDGRSYRYYVDKRDVDKRNDPARLIKEFFVPEGKDIYFECLREASNPNVGCSAFADYGKNLALTFHFRRGRFEHWTEFHDAVLSLLNSLRQ